MCENAKVYKAKICKAQKQYRCEECGHSILLGHQYEHVRALWDGHWQVYKTCMLCVEARDYVIEDISVDPSVCWEHGNMWECLDNIIDSYIEFKPGQLFKYFRLKTKAFRRKDHA